MGCAPARFSHLLQLRTDSDNCKEGEMKTNRNETRGGWGSLGFILTIAALLLITSPEKAYSIENDPHSNCAYCHVDINGDPKELRAAVARLCWDCHKKTVRASSHPVEIEPVNVKVPGDMPLRDGLITCVTCHDIHGSATLIYGMKSYYLRRVTVDTALYCDICHVKNMERPGHKELLQTAHLGGLYANVPHASGSDGLSTACASCHDGSFGNAENVFLMKSGSGAVDHSIGAHYKKVQSNPDKGLAPIKELDKRIRFFGGRIGCGTCHDAYSLLQSRLVMDNEGSRLCSQCHRNK